MSGASLPRSPASDRAGELAAVGAALRRRRGSDALELRATWFGPDVCEPVRLHVAAKRWLTAVEPGALELLSTASRRTLALQGDPFDEDQAAAFVSLRFAEAAIALRRHDDAAKVPGCSSPPLEAYADLLDELAGEELGP